MLEKGDRERARRRAKNKNKHIIDEMTRAKKQKKTVHAEKFIFKVNIIVSTCCLSSYAAVARAAIPACEK